MSQLKPQLPVINWNNPINKGLVLDVPFSDRGGSTPIDIASKAIPSTTGTVSWGADVFGSVALLNKTQYINFPDSSQLSFVNGCTVQGIIKLTATNPNNQIISKRSAFSATGIPFELNCDSATITWRVKGSNAGDRITTGSINSAGTWYNIIGTWNGATQALYRNGILLTSQAVTGTITDNSTSATIAGLPGSGGEQFGGSMALVRVWNRGLNAQEVAQISQNPWATYYQPGFMQSLNSIASAFSSWNIFSDEGLIY